MVDDDSGISRQKKLGIVAVVSGTIVAILASFIHKF